MGRPLSHVDPTHLWWPSSDIYIPGTLHLTPNPGGLITDYTWAEDSCSWPSSAVVLVPAPGGAPPHMGLFSCAVRVIQVNGLWSGPKVTNKCSRDSCATVNLSAHHVSFTHTPAVITDGGPWALVKNLHSSHTAMAPLCQMELWGLWGESIMTTVTFIKEIRFISFLLGALNQTVGAVHIQSSEAAGWDKQSLI